MAHARDLVYLSEDELDERLADARRELFNLRFQLATGQLDNSARMGLVRKDVARVMTVLREREIAEAEGTYVAPSEDERAEARAHLAAEDEAVRAAEAARVSARAGEEHDHDHDHEVAEAGELAEDEVADEEYGDEEFVEDEGEGDEDEEEGE